MSPRLRRPLKTSLRAALLGSTLALAACAGDGSIFDQNSWNPQAAAVLPNSGGLFDKALQDGYATLATQEHDEGDWSDARHFIALTRAAAAGQRPLPDRIEDRDLPPETVADLTKARAALISVYDNGGRILAPTESAAAQIQFDCWIQEQEENIPDQADEVAACRAGFEQALADAQALLNADTVALLQDLDGGVGKVVVTPRDSKSAVTLNAINQSSSVTDGDKAPTAPTTLSDTDITELWGDALAAQPIPPKRFQLYFKANGTELTPESLAMIPDIAADAERRPVLEIEILGHTDTVGKPATNARLSAKRAEAVRDLLVSKGFKAEVITTRGFGEGLLLVKTPDNTPEAKNRRVEVIVR
jgi:outer membrane protein OmpA-like peptidoglycan-associated protein